MKMYLLYEDVSSFYMKMIYYLQYSKLLLFSSIELELELYQA